MLQATDVFLTKTVTRMCCWTDKMWPTCK